MSSYKKVGATFTKVQVTAQETAYPVKVIDACGNELDTDITVKIRTVITTFSTITLLNGFLLF